MTAQMSAGKPGSRSRGVSSQTRLDLATLPRVNLLPPEIAEERRFRVVQGALALAIVVALGVIGLGYYTAAAAQGDAEDELAVAQERHTALQRRAAEYREVPLVLAQVAKLETQLATAMGPEVRWSEVVNDTYRRLPADVGLTRLEIAQPLDVAAVATVTGADESGPIIANMTLTGRATSAGRNGNRAKLALWLDELARQQRHANPYFTISEIKNARIVDFTSSTDINDQALSGRYTSAKAK